MGGSIEVGQNGVGRGGHGLGARVGAEGICGDSAEVRVAVRFCVWACEGMFLLSYSRDLSRPQSFQRLLIDAANDRPRPSL